MKKLLVVILLFIISNAYSQNKIDTLLGSRGIFSKMLPKQIKASSTLTFNLKLTVTSTGKKVDLKSPPTIMYLNTTDGYVGVDKSPISGSSFNPNGNDFFLNVETLTKQSFTYSNKKGEGKMVETMSTNLINTFKNLPIKKLEAAAAKAKKYLSKAITGIPFFVNTFGMQKDLVRYLYGTSLPEEGAFKSYLGNYGVGFYNISNDTFLCASTENKVMTIEITKIEKVNISFNATDFKEKK